ncbi:hypothetical protein [Chryseobacterium sp.]|uniref:hypothetical protein n=1 Tax=Chryseobacterium sp. TaxID=1871047 RepID=UPI0024E1CFAD|nr:hypothetical protein [Chryseobacterium sp.]
MKIQLLCFAILMAFASCSSNNDEILTENPQQRTVDRPNKISWNFPVLSPNGVGNMTDPNIYFEYDSQGRVAKKVGGFIFIDPNTGYNSIHFSKDIYTSVSYNGNIISISTFSSSPDYIVPINKRTFEVDNQGRIMKSIIPSVDNPYFDKHLNYSYDSSGKLIEILTTFPNMPYDPTDPDDFIWTIAKRFTYDNIGNLKKSVEVERHNNVDFHIENTVEFSNFDTAPNPFKKLQIFEEYFYFSLSKNNFQKEVKLYNSGIGESKWVNQYDSNGNVKLYY